MADYTRDVECHSKKRIPTVVLLCAVAYLISYLARLSFSAVMVDMIVSDGYDKTLIAIPLTVLSITYGLGQLIFGWLGDKKSPEKLIFSGLLLTAGMNFAIPFASLFPPTTSIALMTVIWAINGLAQAMMWPPIVKILTARLTPAEYHKNVVYIGWGSSVGTIIIYLFAPVAISLINWRAVFFFASLLALVFAFIWITNIFKAESLVRSDAVKSTNVAQATGEPFHGFAILLLFFIVISIMLQGILRDGIANWMPTYLTEVFRVESTVSILTGVALPIFSMFIMWFSAYIYRKWIKNESLCSVIFFGLCGLSVGVLCIFSSLSPVLSVSMLMMANAATHGVNGMYTSLVIPNFARYGKTAFVTGLINSAAYLGSALSTFGIALISEHFGWTGTMVALFIVSILGMVTAFVSVSPLNRLKKL